MTSMPRTILLAVLSAALFACPGDGGSDGGLDGSADANGMNPTEVDGCTNGCASNQVCDPVRKTCVDPCGSANDGGGCSSGSGCVRVAMGQFQCVQNSTTCAGQVCAPGQVACLSGQCSCLTAAQGAVDSCAPFGQWCSQGTCRNPIEFEQCKVPTPEFSNPPTCPMNATCIDTLFGGSPPPGICVRQCAGNPGACGRDQLCHQLGCLPTGLFTGQECRQNLAVPADAGVDGGLLADGGFVPGPAFMVDSIGADGGAVYRQVIVPAGNTCLLGNTDGVGYGTGTCTYSFLRLWNDAQIPFSSCRPPGGAQLGQACRADYSAGTQATQCGTGLECAQTKSFDGGATGSMGVCLKTCNAVVARNGVPSKPACSTDESCVNIYRHTDPSENAVLGVCMKKCNVFEASANCAAIGTTPTSCVPASASGEFVVSARGEGICVPQQTRLGAAGAACSERDPFNGAVCGNAQVCVPPVGGETAVCTPVCDLSCNLPDGGMPTRCANQPNARCAGGKKCISRTSTTGATVGFCE